jgi:hypothetical protein
MFAVMVLFRLLNVHKQGIKDTQIDFFPMDANHLEEEGFMWILMPVKIMTEALFEVKTRLCNARRHEPGQHRRRHQGCPKCVEILPRPQHDAVSTRTQIENIGITPAGLVDICTFKDTGDDYPGGIDARKYFACSSQDNRKQT